MEKHQKVSWPSHCGATSFRLVGAHDSNPPQGRGTRTYQTQTERHFLVIRLVPKGTFLPPEVQVQLRQMLVDLQVETETGFVEKSAEASDKETV